MTFGQESRRGRAAATPVAAPGAPNPETAADTVAAALVRLPGVDSVSAWAYESEGTSRLLAVRPRRERLALEQAIRRTDGGRVRIEETVGIATADGDTHAPAVEVPVRTGGQAVGIVVIRLRMQPARWSETRATVLAAAAPLVGTILVPALRSRGRQAASADRLRTVIALRAFRPAFQPIVDLASGEIVGYEALTRFLDSAPPERVFSAATELGLSIELEAAALEAILDHAAALPAQAWLNLNVSPGFVLASQPLRSILARWNRRIVLELTEHTAVTDYPGLRRAIGGLGPDVWLAIDDAGAGFASFRHILELAPALVKLDRSIVHAIGEDPGRQAFVAGMARFAELSGITLVGEGVETVKEARALRRLGIALAQGYYFGRPAPVPGGPVGVAQPEESETDDAGSTVESGPRLRLPRLLPRAAPAAEIDRALNIGATLGGALRAVGIESVGSLQAIGAVAAWERLRVSQPALATETTLLRLEGAVRGARVSQLPPSERARLRGLARRREADRDPDEDALTSGLVLPH